MKQPFTFEGPVNLGNPSTEMTILDIARTVKELTGTDSSIVFKELPMDDPKRRQPDITKAFKELGWQPEVSAREGIGKTIEYYKEILR